MHKTSLLLFVAASALAQAQVNSTAGPALDVPGHEISSGSGALPSGVRVHYKSVATPDDRNVNLIATGIAMAPNGLHRFLIDKTTQSYFGYDLVIGPQGADRRYQATFQPLSGAADLVAGISGNRSLHPMPLPKYPPVQYLGDGDVIQLDVMVSADGTRKITDYIEIQAPPSAATAPAADARDFTLDDGSVTFNMERGQNLDHDWLWVNGKPYQGQTAYTAKAGATLWLAMPGKGRYIVSLTPHDGFVRSGVLRGGTVSFQDGIDSYALRFNQPVAPGNQPWNVYVMHDPAYQPSAAMKDVASAGIDRLDNLLSNR